MHISDYLLIQIMSFELWFVAIPKSQGVFVNISVHLTIISAQCQLQMMQFLVSEALPGMWLQNHCIYMNKIDVA